MAKILIIDDAGNHHIITNITDNDLQNHLSNVGSTLLQIL